MARGGRRTGTALLLLAVVLLLPVGVDAQEAPPAEGPPPAEDHRPDGRIRRKSSPVWAGDGIYNTTSVGQTQVAVVPRTTIARFVVRFDNDGTDPDTFVIQGSKNTERFLISYTVDGAPVSSHVRNGTYRLRDVAPGAFRLMTVEVVARSPAAVGDHVAARIAVSSGEEEGLVDRVKAVVYRGPGRTQIVGETFTTLATAERWAGDREATPRFVTNARLYFELAPSRGVRPEIAYAQSAKETGYGNFGGVIDATWRNPCGLKTAEGGGNDDPEAHQRFDTWRQGVTACIDHLALYAGAPGYPRPVTPDPRHFPFLQGVAPTVEQLGTRWAPDPEYGVSIVFDYLHPLLGS